MKLKEIVKKILVIQQNKKYDREIAGRSITYDEWIKSRELREDSRIQADSSNENNSADIVYICCKNGEPVGKYRVIFEKYFAENPNVSVAYGDQDVLEQNGKSEIRKSPWFKPAWSPDLFDCSYYFGSLVAVRRKIFDEACSICGKDRLTDECIGVQFKDKKENLFFVEPNDKFYQFMHICVGLAGGYVTGKNAVGHIPQIVSHCRKETDTDIFLPNIAQKNKYFDVQFREFTDSYSQDSSTIISVIIPSKDNPKILEQCIGSIIETSKSDIPFEIIVVDNGSNEENKTKIDFYIKVLIHKNIKVKYIYGKEDFNFSRMCNRGAKEAAGMFLLFLNDDVELICEDCIAKMAALADRDYTGAVGIKLYYPDSVRIQHAGITNLPMGPVHKLQFQEDNKRYYYGANVGNRNYLAVTAACLMIDRDKFDEVGGFSEELCVAFNDVDLCYNLYECGYFNVCMNDIYAYHHESLSRGNDESEEKLNRLLIERQKLYARHPELEDKDPYYPIGLGRESLDTSVRPEYETAGNASQCVEKLQNFNPTEYRQDNCLLFRTEFCNSERAYGYGIVLGDDNSCYKRILLFKDEASGHIYGIELAGQYRPDLTENMPDQANVGLCGFDVTLKNNVLPGGRYRLGMAVSNRVSATRIYNFGNRILNLD